MIMKKIVLLLIATVTFSAHSFAQTDSTTIDQSENKGWEQKTLFSSGNGKIEHGFYGAVMPRYGQIDGNGAFLFGGKGAWIINHNLAIGISGNSLTSRNYTSPNKNAVAGYFGGNGGFMIEPILFADRPLHVALPVVVGGGFVGKYVFIGDSFWDNGDYVSFGYIEPGIELEANIVSWFRVSVGAYYAFRWDVDSYNMSSDILSPLSLGASFKFGIF